MIYSFKCNKSKSVDMTRCTWLMDNSCFPKTNQQPHQMWNTLIWYAWIAHRLQWMTTDLSPWKYLGLWRRQRHRGLNSDVRSNHAWHFTRNGHNLGLTLHRNLNQAFVFKFDCTQNGNGSGKRFMSLLNKGLKYTQSLGREKFNSPIVATYCQAFSDISAGGLCAHFPKSKQWHLLDM